jgi:hypothetical protein
VTTDQRRDAVASSKGKAPKTLSSDTKLAAIRTAMAADDWDTALKLASRFQRLGEQASVIRRAADFQLRPNFYRQLGYDGERVRAEGIAALKERFSVSWSQTSSRD